MKRWRSHRQGRRAVRLAAGVGLFIALGSPAARGAGNLLVNGSFDDPGDPLAGWTYDYRYTENRLYADNYQYVSVIPEDGGRKSVLKLHGTRDILWTIGQGVKVDSSPIPYDPGATYRLTVYGRTTGGPNCRIYFEGYQWKPGIKPHDNPALSDLRCVYRQGGGRTLYFGGEKKGPFSNPSETWRKADCTFPGKDPSEAAEQHLKKVKFLVIHIIAIDGFDGDILIDDVDVQKGK